MTPLLDFGPPVLIVNRIPVLAAVTGAIRTILFDAAVLGVIVLVFRRLRQPWMRIALLPLLAFVRMPGGFHTPAEFAFEYSIALLAVSTAALIVYAFARRNYLAYAAILWLVALRGPLAELYGNTKPVHFWTLLAILIAGLLWAIVPARKPAYAR